MNPTQLTADDLEPLVARIGTLTTLVDQLLEIHASEHCPVHGLSRDRFEQMREELNASPNLRRWLADLSRRS